MVVELSTLGRDGVAKFAAQELAKYLSRMSPDLQICFDGQGADRVIRLGLFEDFGLDAGGLQDRRYDDAFAVNIDGLSGYIAGSNDRSILYGVYRFLEQMGCHWARHGADGEYIPVRDIGNLRVSIQDRAFYRHRGVCIEGAVSFENMLDNIDWVLKAGFNSYFLEFFTPYTFFERYYSHKNNPWKQPEPLPVDVVKQWTSQLETEIKKRGLLYHAVGHAWTCESLGLEGLAWDAGDYELPDEKKELLALVNGRREIWHGIPLNTNLCYSNPRARQGIVQTIVDYMRRHDFVDFLHVWLADDTNNHCECEECVKSLPSDLYVVLLNEIDEELTRQGIDVKIVFLAYVDLLWAPQRETFVNPDRFLFLFAPITRTYSSTYDYDTSGVRLPSYERNHLSFPKTVAENIEHMNRWRKVFGGEGLAYEYYFMWDHFFDPGYYGMTDVLSQDIKNLEEIGLNGVISDQCQRSFFPTGFPMYAMGRLLWDRTLSIEDIAREYFTKTFGEDGEKCRQYCCELSRLFDPVYLRGEKASGIGRSGEGMNLWSVVTAPDLAVDPDIPARLAKIPETVADFLPVIRQNAEKATGGMRSSWRYLIYHGEIVSALARALLELETGSRETARELWDGVADLVSRYEDELQSVLDVFEFVEVLGRRFR